MKYLFKVVSILLSVVTGALFLYSAYTKAFPVYVFEYTMVRYASFPWWLASVCARLFVGIEAGLGLMIATCIYGSRKWVLKWAMLLLVIFNIYLVYLWVRFGNDVNCGCFGDAVWMSPGASLVKNFILLGVIGFLYRYNRAISGKWAQVALGTTVLCSLILPYALLGIPLKVSGYRLNLQPLYTYSAEKKDIPAIDLNKGKHIIAFLSPSCSHCRKAALKMKLLRDKDTTLPFYFVIGGNTSDLTDFWKDSHAAQMPYTRVDRDHFMAYTGGVFPVILFVNNDTVEARVEYVDMTLRRTQDWLKK